MKRGVVFVFVGKATEQAAADSRKFGRIEAEILLFRHFGRNRVKCAHKLGAADFFATAADAAEQFCFVSDTDLT